MWWKKSPSINSSKYRFPSNAFCCYRIWQCLIKIPTNIIMIKHKWWCHFQLNFSVLVFFALDGWMFWIYELKTRFFWVMQGMNFLDGCWVTNCLDCRGWYHSLLLRFEGWGGPIKKACLDILFAWNFFEVRACLFCIRSGKFKI